MAEKLKKRGHKEKKMFGGMFERARKTEGDLYAEEDLRRQRAEIRKAKANEAPQVSASAAAPTLTVPRTPP